ncbi:unnamed protein product [Chondrus crispus]|uniref:Uncharacterized protein n=1 Tax=Chondrus crispus TaxID=2769 RepID=R7QJ60_CHOCR|nr:unnamed protein product [Chondrus crispus]CDF37450.1 unnamed protein product [Chondrus crispus]|eukprot:XP_005717269.1 unnamed protein product [Chondrus crispus]
MRLMHHFAVVEDVVLFVSRDVPLQWAVRRPPATAIGGNSSKHRWMLQQLN